MKVLFSISSIASSSGGPSQSVSMTLLGLRNCNVDTELLTIDCHHNDTNVIDGNFVHLVPETREKKFCYSNKIKEFLSKRLDYNLYHIQGIWQYPSFISARIARQQDKPYIITPRGMLYPQAFTNSKFVKRMLLKFFLLKDLNKASAIHVTCIEEMKHLRSLGVTSPIAVVPNPVEIPTSMTLRSHETLRFGYLGRIHPRKNVERLLYTWAKLGDKVAQSELVIIGDGDKEYMDFLKQEQERLNLRNVIFTGFLSGKAKIEALNMLSYLVVPSDFENFGMIIPEALIMGIPVIASKGTPWEELQSNNCGWWVDNDIDTLVKTLTKAIDQPESERLTMGKNGQRLIQENYRVEVVTEKISQLYDWILKKKNKPSFVFKN